MSTDRTTELIQKSMAFSENGHVTTTYSDDGVVQGVGFVFEKNFVITNASPTLYILFDYTTYTPTASQAGLIFVNPPKFQTSSGPVTVKVYRGTDYAGGTPFDAINPNTTATKTTSGTTLTSGATGTTKGDIVLEYLVGSETPGVSGSSGGGAGGVSFFIRENTSKTLVEITNASGNDITFHYGQGLFEI